METLAKAAAPAPYSPNRELPGVGIMVSKDYIGLGPHDVVGITFWLACAAMLASSFFFWLERCDLPEKWKPSMTIAGLVTGVAFWNYYYMREAWVLTQMSPTVYRYCDWLITVPLQIMEFYYILKTSGPVSTSVLYRLQLGSVLMLVFGYLGEAFIFPYWPCFIVACICWFYIIGEVWFGGASTINSSKGTASSQAAFNSIRIIVTFPWALYPLGYILGGLHSTESTSSGAACWLNGIYNLADLVNKMGFGLTIWAAARMDVEM